MNFIANYYQGLECPSYMMDQIFAITLEVEQRFELEDATQNMQTNVFNNIAWVYITFASAQEP